MNVRSFLQFTVGTNKGIRQTIMREPHMFLAYNNGIAATADAVELTADGRGIRTLTGLQIVNGGQTTASIFYTQRKDRADVSQIFVQMKLSVIKAQDDVGTIVNNISRYANTQNKVSESDLSANSPFHIELEKLSRTIWTPGQTGVHWFYERARAQYKNALAREFTAAGKKKFELQNPRKNLFVKEDLAKYINVWNELPWRVVQGNQKNYKVFIDNLKAKEQKPNSLFFEDAIAKAILFRTAEELYGRQPKAIGDLRYVTVPYTLAWLSRTLVGRLDLLKIWKQQHVSDAMRTMLFNLMVAVEDAIKKSAPVALYGEWAKKEECWKRISGRTFPVDLSVITADLIDPSNPPVRQALTDDDAQRMQQRIEANWLCSLPYTVWEQISEWGRLIEQLTFNQRQIAVSISAKIKQWGTSAVDRLTAAEINSGAYCLEVVMAQAPQLLDAIADEMLPDEAAPRSGISADLAEITIELVQKAVAWDRKKKILSIKYHLMLKDVAERRKSITGSNRQLIAEKIGFLKLKGFNS